MMFYYDNKCFCASTEPEREHIVVTRENVWIHLRFWRHVLCQHFSNSVTLLFVKTSPKPTGWTEEFKIVKLTQFLERWHATNTLSWWGGGDSAVHLSPPSLCFACFLFCLSSPCGFSSDLMYPRHYTGISVGRMSSWCGFIKPKHSGPLQARLCSQHHWVWEPAALPEGTRPG